MEYLERREKRVVLGVDDDIVVLVVVVVVVVAEFVSSALLRDVERVIHGERKLTVEENGKN